MSYVESLHPEFGAVHVGSTWSGVLMRAMDGREGDALVFLGKDEARELAAMLARAAERK